MAKEAATIIESDWLTAASQSLRFRLTTRRFSIIALPLIRMRISRSGNPQSSAQNGSIDATSTARSNV